MESRRSPAGDIRGTPLRGRSATKLSSVFSMRRKGAARRFLKSCIVLISCVASIALTVLLVQRMFGETLPWKELLTSANVEVKQILKNAGWGEEKISHFKKETLKHGVGFWRNEWGGVRNRNGFYLSPETVSSIESTLKMISEAVARFLEADMVQAAKFYSLKKEIIPNIVKEEEIHQIDKQKKKSKHRIVTQRNPLGNATGFYTNEAQLMRALHHEVIQVKPGASGLLNRPNIFNKLPPSECVNFSKPLGEYDRVGKAQARGNLIGYEFRSVLADNQVPSWCPELAVNRWEPCIWGSGLIRAKLMEKATFFIRTAGPTVHCYVRATGVGIILPQLTQHRQSVFRVDYVPQQEGEYKLWVMCDSVILNHERPLPDESFLPPALHQYSTMYSPYDLVVEPNPEEEARGCDPCDAAAINEPGQWVRRDVLECQCGEEVMGAINEWFVDDYVWAPRTCAIPFRKRSDFLRRFKGKSIAFVGDESVQGHFVDFSNWLRGVGPDILQDPEGYQLDELTFQSSWDGIVAGFNKEPFEQDADIVMPNPLTSKGIKIAYFPASQRNEWWPKIHAVMNGDRPETSTLQEQRPLTNSTSPYDVLIFSYGTWFGTLVSEESKFEEDENIGKAVRELVENLKCPKERRSWCGKPFKGRVLYRSNTGRFDEDNYCGRPKPGDDLALGKACAINSAVEKMFQDHFSLTGDAQTADGSLLYLDAFNVAFARSDRTVDGVVFYPRKCSMGGVRCDHGTKEIQDCCWNPNLFPHVVSLTLTNMMVNMMWDDPVIFGSQEEETVEEGTQDETESEKAAEAKSSETKGSQSGPSDMEITALKEGAELQNSTTTKGSKQAPNATEVSKIEVKETVKETQPSKNVRRLMSVGADEGEDEGQGAGLERREIRGGSLLGFFFSRNWTSTGKGSLRKERRTLV